ncbi:MAG: ABC transporter ATP-binding protein, partial [Proteobacteria bacterium]|nr:ABC transporter ATP-binding protein [Pseudomonadota bacterium]
MPKRIVNDAILSDPERFPVELFGLELGHFTFLFALCGVFLILVVINQGFKYYINLFKGLTGERMLRRLRFDLYSRVLRFPLPTFRNMSQGEIIPMITAEVEPLGGFIGDAYAQPAFQGGQLLVIIAFLFVANPIMAGAAVALYPLQVYVIPKLQRRVNLLGKERVRLVRKLSDRIGETVQGVQEVHVHDTSRLERADFSIRLGEIFEVRYKIYRQKFVIKFINNFIQQLGPFFFYSLGGFLVISESLDIGTLLASIAAHKDLAAPWKQLLNYYQISADSRIKYENVVSQFEPAGMHDSSLQDTEPEQITPLTGEVATFNLTLNDDQDVPVVDGVNLKFSLDQSVAVVGAGGPGRDNLMLLLARLLDPHGGRVTVGGQDTIGLPEAITGRRMSFVGSAGYVFAATIASNLYYGLKHRQIGPNPDDEAATEHKQKTA